MGIQGINPKHVDQLQDRCQQFNQAKPFQHLQLDSFLDTSWCQQLVEQFPRFDPNMAVNENGKIGGKAVHQGLKNLGPAYQKLDQMFRSDDFTHYISQLTGIPDLVFDPHYFGGGTHENLSGQGLDPHVDFTHHPMTGHHRRLNLILYLNHEWDSAWGGDIQLHKNPRLKPAQDEVVCISPVFNRLVIFATHHHSWHGFPPIHIPEDKAHISRKSIALYYYTKQKPKDFKKAHSTIYVDRHLDPSIQAGTTLSEQQMAEIQRLMDSRDQHLERLYATISHQMDDLNRIKKALGPFKALIQPIKKWLGKWNP